MMSNTTTTNNTTSLEENLKSEPETESSIFSSLSLSQESSLSKETVQVAHETSLDPEEDEDEDDDEEEEDDEDEEEEEDYFEETTLIASNIKPEREEEIGHLPLPKKRGRPSKAESLKRRESEDLNYNSFLPKKRGRRPLPKEEKERLKEEKRQRKKEEKRGEKKKPGRKAIELTEEEKERRENNRRAKYEEFKRNKAEKAAKKAERNELLRVLRKKKKEEEFKQREAYDKRMQELKASFLDENTQMSSAVEDLASEFLIDESSQGSLSSLQKRNELSHIDRIKAVTAESLFEYRWPLEGKSSEHYFLQEQVCEYLGVKSFKRRYPDITRKKLEIEEREFLVEMKVVNVTQADLGLTAIPSSEVLDIMSRDFYDKYDEYMAVVADRKDSKQRQTSYSTVTVEKHKLADFVIKAVKSAAEWNKAMNVEIREKRKAYLDLQTMNVHYPMNNKGRMRVLPKPKLGNYPLALIPGQFSDYYQSYSSTQLKYMPLNTTIYGPPSSGTRVEHLNSESSESETSSESSSESSSDSENDNDGPPNLSPVNKFQIDYEKPGAICKNCQGDRLHNKIGVPEKFLHCSKCKQSSHPTCVGLNLDLLKYVTNYDWECTECKNCSQCNDHRDEDKMLFCDLCDRGYHIYCVGLDEVPIGRWHCVKCSFCSACGTDDPGGENAKWAFEYKSGSMSKTYSQTYCTPCYKWIKKGLFCPECNMAFGRESVKGSTKDLETVFCWVCSRQHHAGCVGQANFICSACQRRTQDRSVGAAQKMGGLNSISQGDSEIESFRRSSSDVHSVTCDICKKIYKNKSTLYSHKNRDHGYKVSSTIFSLR